MGLGPILLIQFVLIFPGGDTGVQIVLGPVSLILFVVIFLDSDTGVLDGTWSCISDFGCSDISSW